MSVPRMLRLSESDLQRLPHACVRGPSSPVVAGPLARQVPADDAGEAADAVAGGDRPAARGTGFVLIPYPVSANRYWRSFKGRVVVSKEAVAYKARVAGIFAMCGRRMVVSGPVAVHYMLHPRLTKAGAASKTCMDLGNMEKVLSDALNGVAYTDDKQIKRILLEVAAPIDGGGVSISVEAL